MRDYSAKIQTLYLLSLPSVSYGTITKFLQSTSASRVRNLESWGVFFFTMQKEIWKDIEGYEGYYQVSSLGRVRSLDRVVINSKNVCRKHTGKILKINFIADGYLGCSLYKNRRMKTARIHRLVAKMFIKNNGNKKCVNHKNGIKTDNRVDNLEWCTHSENMNHAVQNGLKLGSQGSSHFLSKLTEESVRNIRLLSKICGVSNVDLSAYYKVDSSIISKIVNYKIWKHVV